MSTITSPRLSSALTTPTSSRRASLDPGSPSRPSHTSSAPQPQASQQQRRNRAALRDYYNLKAAASGQQQQLPQQHDAGDSHEVQDGELDKSGFDAEKYVQSVLEKEGLEGVLRVESQLVNEIRSLDGERKALVYDNYSKLIAATDTIRKMRTNMAPLFPTTSTLSPAISHIAETASSLASSLQASSASSHAGEGRETSGAASTTSRRKQREAVKRALDTPERLKVLVRNGKEEDARKEWEAVEAVLNRWEEGNGGHVEGLEELRSEARKALKAEGG